MAITNDMKTAQAISALTNHSEWAWTGDNYSNINWVKIDTQIPTEAEIEAKIKAMEIDEIKQVKDKAKAKAALLERLGITADEAALLVQ
jgi:hypothetical protein